MKISRRWKIPPCAPFSSWTNPSTASSSTSPANPDPAYPLKEWDVITQIGDTPVDDEGMITSGSLHLYFTYLVQKTARERQSPSHPHPGRQGDAD